VDDDSLTRLFVGDFSHSSVALDRKGATCIRIHDAPVLDENNATLTCACGITTEEAKGTIGDQGFHRPSGHIRCEHLLKPASALYCNPSFWFRDFCAFTETTCRDAERD